MASSFSTVPETLVNTHTPGNQDTPSVAVLAGGGHVISWTSAEQDGNGLGIYAQLYAASGEKVGGEFRVNTVTGGNQRSPETVALADGGFAIFWDNSWNGTGVYGQRYNAEGQATGSQITIHSVYGSHHPTATTLSNGNLVVAWTPGNTPNVWGRIFDPNGNELAVKQLSTHNGTSGTIYAPAITPLPDGGFAMSWGAENITLGTTWDIYAQRYDAAGNPVGPYSRITSGVAVEALSDIASLADGGFVVAWDNEADIYFQRFNAAGEMTGGARLANTFTVDKQINPSLVALPDGGFLIAWTSYSQMGVTGESDVFAQRFDKDGLKIGDKFRINGSTLLNQANVSLAARQDGGFVAAFESDTSLATTKFNVKAVTFLPPDQDLPYFTALNGGPGNDLLSGTVGSDRLVGFAGNDTLIGWAGDDVLSGGAGNDSLSGGPGSDHLFGGTGDDTMDGGEGADYLIGGSGNDLYIINNAEDEISESPDEGLDTVHTSLNSYHLPNGVEYLVYTGQGAFTGSGNALDNRITGGNLGDHLSGGAGNDTLDGGAGADTLRGGTGDDVFLVDTVDDIVIELAGEGTDEIRTSLSDYQLGDHVEILTFTGTTTFSGTGNAAANTITGGVGDDMLDGGGGADRLIGGKGDDVLTGGSGADLFVFALDDGNDVITDFDAAAGDRIGQIGWDDYTVETDGSDNAVIVYGEGSRITLAGIQAQDVVAAWFIAA